jgi:hypothetical protein
MISYTTYMSYYNNGKRRKWLSWDIKMDDDGDVHHIVSTLYYYPVSGNASGIETIILHDHEWVSIEVR